MRHKEIEATISITSYFILATLVLLALSGCGRQASKEPNLNPRGADDGRDCGYAFTLESNQSILQSHMTTLIGNWRDDHTSGFTTVRDGSVDLYQTQGFTFDFLNNVYGENFLRYSSVSPNFVLDSIVKPATGFNALRLSVPLKSMGDGTYRALEAYTMDKDGYNTCRTFAYKIVNASTIVITPGKTHFISGGQIPSISEYIKGVTNPDSYTYTRQP